MADYVLSAKGTYDGSNFDSGVDNSASKLKGLKDTAAGVGSQVAGFFADSFGSVAKSIGTEAAEQPFFGLILSGFLLAVLRAVEATLRRAIHRRRQAETVGKEAEA